MFLGDTASPDAQLRAVCQMLTDTGLWIGPRRHLEKAPDFRQIIPYVVLRNNGKYLAYRRGGNIEEGRLASKLSIGWGGHIDLPDVCTVRNEIDMYGTLMSAAERELKEELGMIFANDPEFVGMIVDSTDEVDRVHMGVVLMIDSPATVSSKEDSQVELGWLTPQELDEEQQENWTTAIVSHMVKQLPKP